MCTATVKRALALALLIAAGFASAQDAAAPRPAGEAPLVPLPTGPAVPAREAEGLPPALAGIAATQRATANEQAKLNLLTLQQQTRELQQEMDLGGGVAAAPQLIGIRGAGTRFTAEFLIGSAVLEARPGDWVTAEYRLDQVLANGVVLSKRGERTPRTVLFGRRTEVRGNLFGTAAAPSVPPAMAAPVAAPMLSVDPSSQR